MELLSLNAHKKLHIQMCNRILKMQLYKMLTSTRMWANAQPDGRPAEHRWRPLFNAAKFG